MEITPCLGRLASSYLQIEAKVKKLFQVRGT